ncbi:MAG: MFS transporter [Terracidiphilus sp.]|nr:MFS transporter [Terracidiphilus sp.]MDR3776191.1 MFS transporter [Terracidiphilus sp.]
MTANSSMPLSAESSDKRVYNFFLLVVAGLGGLLYGMDIGIIGGALPYLQATSSLTAAELSMIVAAVLLGAVFSTLFAGMLADWMGRKPLMILCGITFIASIPMIALSHGYAPLLYGRLLEGISAGLIGVVMPLYLAECLAATDRGKGTGVFQWLPTASMVFAALLGIYFSYRLQSVAKTGDASVLFAFKDQAWRNLFWVSLPPGILFLLGSLMVTESPRWLFKKGKKEQAYAALLRSRTPQQATIELQEMEESERSGSKRSASGKKIQGTLLHRRYIVPFLLACIILFCNTATGINSIIGYNTSILLQSGLSDLYAHWGYVIFTSLNFLLTMVGMTLVDRKGRKFLLILGTSGIIVSLACVGALFLRTEKASLDARVPVQAMVTPNQELTLSFGRDEAARLLAAQGDAGRQIEAGRASLAIIYSYGDFTAATSFVRSDDPAARPVEITRASCVPTNKMEAFFKNPFANLDAARTAPLTIKKAVIGQVPDASHGWKVALGLFAFMAFFALGPGVCVWLALSELMPTRIRSNGMSIALVINQLVSTTLSGIFLPFVSKHGYSSMFFLFAGFTVVYFLVAVFLLPETKGKTLEEIEAHFEGKAAA